jgi:hypothetical protein
MRIILLVAALLFSFAETSQAAMLKLHMGDFSFPIWNETKTEIIDQGTGGALNLLIDDAIADGDGRTDVGFFAGAIKGGFCKEGVNGVEFTLDKDHVTEVHTLVDGITSIGFQGHMKDGKGNLAMFSLRFEGGFAADVGDSLANIDYKHNTWFDSIYFELKGSSVDFTAAVPYYFDVASVSEPSALVLLLAGFLGVLAVRRR